MSEREPPRRWRGAARMARYGGELRRRTKEKEEKVKNAEIHENATGEERERNAERQGDAQRAARSAEAPLAQATTRRQTVGDSAREKETSPLESWRGTRPREYSRKKETLFAAFSLQITRQCEASGPGRKILLFFQALSRPRAGREKRLHAHTCWLSNVGLLSRLSSLA